MEDDSFHESGALRAFVARYETDQGRAINIVLGTPVTIADRDLSRLKAYPLQVHVDSGALRDDNGNSAPAYDFDAIYYLDQDLLVVRVDLICSQRQGDGCKPDVHTHWSVQGLPPPLGVFWPRLEDVESLPLLGSQLPWESTFRARTKELVVSQGGIPVGLLLDASGPIRFERGSDVPFQIDGEISIHDRYTVSAKLISLEQGEELLPANSWPKAILQEILEDTGPVMFWGEESQVPERNFTHLDALDKLVELSSNARALLNDGGCVAGLKVNVLSGQTTSNMLGGIDHALLGVNWSTFTFDIVAAGGVGREFELTYRTKNQVEPEDWQVEETGDSVSVGCAEKWRTAVKTSVPEFLQLVESLSMAGNESTNTYGVAWVKTAEWRAAVGNSIYFAMPFPREQRVPGAFITNQLWYLPGPGWLDNMLLPPETIAALDAGKPSED